LEAVELVVESALALHVGEERDPFGRGAKLDAVAGEAGADAGRAWTNGLRYRGGASLAIARRIMSRCNPVR